MVFGFRANSVTVLPVVLACAWVRWRGLGRAWRIAAVACASAGVLVAMVVPACVPWKRADVVATILACEHVSALRLARDEGRADLAARHTLDAYGEGATQRAVARHDWTFFHTTCFGEDPPLPARVVRADGGIARDAFWRLSREEPALYMRTKVRIWITLLGLRHAGAQLFIARNPPDWTTRYGVDLAPSHPTRGDAVLDAGERFTGVTLALWMPYFWIGATTLALVLRRVRGTQGWLLAAGWSYYAGFLVLAPSFEWRYFLPAFVIVAIALATSLSGSCARAPRSPGRTPPGPAGRASCS
jgi:hypothetical protein